MNIKGQGHSLTFIEDHSVSTFSNFFSLETPRPIDMKLYEFQRSRSFIDLGPNHSDSIFLNFFSFITPILTYHQHSGERYRTNGPLVLF